MPGFAGLPPVPSRTLAAPDGTLLLDGEPAGADVYALAADAELARGGAYLLVVNTSLAVRVLLDGVLVHERRAFAAWSPLWVTLPVELAPGRHRLVLKLARGTGGSGVSVSLARADGAPSDAAFTATAAGPAPAGSTRRPVVGAPLFTPREVAAALEPRVGPVLARLLAARDALLGDREGAKALVAEAQALAPASAAVQVAVAAVRRGDPTLDDEVARARAEAALQEALRLDPGHAEARLELAATLRAQERRDAVDELLAGLPPAAAARPRALVERARAAEERGLVEVAEALVGEALAAGGSCDAAELGLSLALRRGAVAREDELAQVAARCRGGRERLAAHLRRRGDVVGALSALAPVAAARPWAVDVALPVAEALVARGDPAAAAATLSACAALWPRSARLWKALADARELAGDPDGARAARERALLLDGADLPLRRALALEDGREVLDELAFDPAAAVRAYEAAGKRDGTATVMVLDGAIVDLHPGGAATERTQQVIHVLDQAGVESAGEVSVAPGAEVLALRTLKPDGRALSPERPSGDKGTLSLAGLEPGDYVVLDTVRAIRSPAPVEGYVADPFYFQIAGARLFRSAYVVRAPAGMGFAVEPQGVPAPELRREGPAEVVRAERTDVPALVPEPDAPGGDEYLPHLRAGIGGGLPALQRTAGDALVGRTRPTLELDAFAAAVRARAGSRAAPVALARAAYAAVGEAVQGDGGPLEDASVSLSRGRGSRLLVLKAVLGALGLPARVALVRPYGADPTPRRFPSLATYGVRLLRVEAGGEVLWLDPSIRRAPFGALPPWAAGCEALLLPEPGEPVRTDRTPERPSTEVQRETTVRVELDADGGAALSGVDRYTGFGGAALKVQLQPLDAAARRQAVESMLGRSFRGVVVSEVTFTGEDSAEEPLTVRWRARASLLARRDGEALLLEGTPFPARLGERFVQVATRTIPLLIQAPERSVQRLEVVPPPGQRAEPAAPVRLDSPFGAYRREEHLEGTTLIREEHLELERGRIAPDRYLQLAEFAARVDSLQEEAVPVTR